MAHAALSMCALIALATLSAEQAAGQATTNCQVVGNMVRCNTTQGVIQLPGWGADVGRNLGNVINQAMIARRQAQYQQAQQAAYTAALQEAETRARVAAEESRRAAEENARRVQAQVASETDREHARQRLFAEKAISVVVETSEKFAFQGKVQQAFVQAVTLTLQDLYKVSPEASRLQIFDAIAPKLTIIGQAQVRHFSIHLDGPVLKPRTDSLALVVGSPEWERFMFAGMKAVQPIFMEWPDEIDHERFAQAMEPVYRQFRKPRAVAPKGTLAPKRRPPTISPERADATQRPDHASDSIVSEMSGR